MNLTKDLAKKISDEVGVGMGSTLDTGDFLDSMTKITNKLEQTEEEKIKLPIGKLFSMKKSENKEAMSAGNAGGFVSALSGEMKEKWSKKYKDSINCSNPKGFSQRAHCAGKTKKMETKEATSSASVGAYDAPGFEDVKMRGNNKKGSGRSFKITQIPDGSFVEPKEKCKKFPYCNQGDIRALKITKPKKTLSEIIDECAKKYGLSTKVVKELINNEINKNK